MMSELDVLKLVSQRLEARGIAYMLTGSFALAYYATPRMTRDLDLVVALVEQDVETLVATFSGEFYLDAVAARTAVATRRLFNLLHLESGIKVDFIVRKDSDYRQVEFGRRVRVAFAGVETWIASREDLMLSKLVWAQDTGSELQRRDVRALLGESLDRDYLDKWATHLGVLTLLEEIAQ